MKNRCRSRSETKISLSFLKLFFPSPLAAWCSSMQQDIAKCVLWSLVQKEVLNLLHTYVVVSTLDTYNPCNRRYLLHVSLCLSIAWVIALKLGIQNPHNKKYLLHIPFCLLKVPTFPDIIKFLDFCDWFQKSGYYLNTRRKATGFKVFGTLSDRVLL